MVNKKTKKIICTNLSNGKCHDFRLFKESGVRLHPKTKSITDSGYEGIQNIHMKAELPKKKTKKDKINNRLLSCERVLNENIIGSVKRFKIIANCYRNRRKRFALRFNLISGIYNFEIN